MPSERENILRKAYFLSLEDPSRSPEENWYLAEQAIKTRKGQRQSLWNFLLMAWLAFLFLWLLGALYNFLRGSGLDRWPIMLGYYITVVCSSLVAIRFAAQNRSLRGGMLWPFSGLIKLFRTQGKTIWDFLNLIGGAALLGALASIISYFVTLSNQASQERLQRDRENQQLLISYVNDITKLVDGKSREYENLNNDLKISISTRTLNTIQALSGDSFRQGAAIRFASRVTPFTICEGIHPGQPCRMPDNIPVDGVTLRNFDIVEKGVDQMRAKDSNEHSRLKQSEITSTTPRGFFAGTDLSWSDLRGSKFDVADFTNTKLRMSNLTGTNYLSETILVDTDFAYADLSRAFFQGRINLAQTKHLHQAIFHETRLSHFGALSASKELHQLMCPLIRTNRIKIIDIPPTSQAQEQFIQAFGCDTNGRASQGRSGQTRQAPWAEKIQQAQDALGMQLRDFRLAARYFVKR